MLKFEWDANKARINIRKHGVSFSDAVSVFLDEQALTILTKSASLPLV